VVLRVLSGIGGVVGFLIGTLITVGAALAAPVGMLLVRRWAARHDRQPSRIASFVGAVLASSATAALVWGLIFALMPAGTFQEMQKASAESQQKQTVKMPEWYTRAFPQAEATDSATQRLTRSSGFLTASLVFGFLFMALFFGVLGGASGWVSSMLLSYAWRGIPVSG
jgi:hypothetical protein